MEQAALPVRAARVTPAGPGRGPLASAPEPRLRNAPNWQFCAVDHDNLAILKGVPNRRSALSRAVAAPPCIHCPSQSPVLNGPAADVTGEVSDPGLRRHIRAGRPVGRGAAWRPQAGRGAHGRFEITSGQAARIAFMQSAARMNLQFRHPCQVSCSPCSLTVSLLLSPSLPFMIPTILLTSLPP